MEEVKQEFIFNSDDLVAIQNLIDIASRRGAFPAAEATMVGQIFDRLKGFNDFIAKQAAEALKTPQEELE